MYRLRRRKRTEQGHAIDFRYTGVIKMPPEVSKIFNMDSDMVTVPFGHASMFIARCLLFYRVRHRGLTTWVCEKLDRIPFWLLIRH